MMDSRGRSVQVPSEVLEVVKISSDWVDLKNETTTSGMRLEAALKELHPYYNASKKSEDAPSVEADATPQNSPESPAPAPLVASDGRSNYVFVLLVDRQVSRVLCDWWNSRSDAERAAEGMCVASRSFRSSAGIAVYQRYSDGLCRFAFGKDIGNYTHYPDIAKIEGMTIEEVLPENIPLYSISEKSGDPTREVA